MKIEFIFALEDGTWVTEVMEVPNDYSSTELYSPQWYDDILGWGTDHPPSRKVVYTGVFDAVSRKDEEDEEECGGPCCYDMRCDKCESYWERVISNGLYLPDVGWTQDALREFARY